MKSFSNYIYLFIVVTVLVACNQSKNQKETYVDIDQILSEMSLTD